MSAEVRSAAWLILGCIVPLPPATPPGSVAA